MSRFTAAQYDVTGETKNGRPVVCLTTPLDYHVGFLGSGWIITAPAGFCCDLASLPIWFARTKAARRLADLIARSAIVHDRMRQDRNCRSCWATTSSLKPWASIACRWDGG